MKKIFFLTIALFSIVSSAQDYQIDFLVYGNSEINPDSVMVQNLNQGHMLTLGGQDVLHLVASATRISNSETSGEVQIYPNPFSSKATIVFPNEGELVLLSLFDMSGRLVTEKVLNQPSGMTVAEVRGLSPGSYVIHIETESSAFSEVVLSTGDAEGLPEISPAGYAKIDFTAVPTKKTSQVTGGLVDMQYHGGDSLIFTAYLDGQQSEVRIVPIVSTTLSFDFQQDRVDITASDTITSEGGVLELSDEFGNRISVNFPPGAIRDTSAVSLTLHGTHKYLPMGKRQLRTFEIAPLDIDLYLPVIITITYEAEMDELAKTALFHVETQDWLIPLSDHKHVEDSTSVSAATLQFGEFAEGMMSLEQINTQFDLLLTNLDIAWTGTVKAAGMEKQAFSGDDGHKKIWQGWKKMAGGFISFFYLKELNGFYDNQQNSRADDQDKLCEKVLNVAVKEVLDLPLPDDLCDQDYTFTLASMVHDMEILGCEGTTEYTRLNERFSQTLINCSSYLVINMELNIESGGFTVNTSGTVPIHTTRHMSSTATVEGTGTLQVSGEASAGGPCSGVISGETAVDVNGGRDGSYTYSLTLNTYQTATLTTTCPGEEPVVTPLVGAGVREITLSLANNFSFTNEEPVEGGTFMMDVVLVNPYVSLPSED